MTPSDVWQHCFNTLQQDLPAQQFNTWIKRLKVGVTENKIILQAPNKFVVDWVKNKYLNHIIRIVSEVALDSAINVVLQNASDGSLVSATKPRPAPVAAAPVQAQFDILSDNDDPEFVDNSVNNSMNNTVQSSVDKQSVTDQVHQELVTIVESQEQDVVAVSPQNEKVVNEPQNKREVQVEGGIRHNSRLQNNYTFDSFIQGNSNQLALAAARQVSDNPGSENYNPLFIYGGVGLGKTHLMQAVGHSILQRNPQAKVLYVSSERFVADMVKAMQQNAFTDFKRYYRSLDALLIDDIQFFAKKDRSQEEFFHTFNALFEGKQQIILTSDRFPKDIEGMEDRLKSRFGWGMTIGVEPPELETRVAILKKKASTSTIILPDDAAFFIAQKIRSNVRELEGALRRVIANAEFTKRKRITVGFVKDTLKDLLASHDKTISIDNIQRTVAEYYNIKIADLTSKRRTRSVARPRQMAMSLAKELTNHSYPEIGQQFGGRDHTTVLHAVRKVKELVETTSDFREDYKNLKRTLNS